MDYRYVKRLLEIERHRAQGNIDNINENGLLTSLKDSIDEISSYDNHPADIASETFERSKDLALRDNSQLILHQVERAEDKLEEGTYGYCDQCGSTIQEDRLRILPYATKCIHCEEELDRMSLSKGRPIEEEVLGVPFSRTYNDGKDSVATDGEDIYQQVERFGSSATPQDYPQAKNAQDSYDGSDERIGSVWKEGQIAISYDRSKKQYVDEDDKVK